LLNPDRHQLNRPLSRNDTPKAGYYSQRALAGDISDLVLGQAPSLSNLHGKEKFLPDMLMSSQVTKKFAPPFADEVGLFQLSKKSNKIKATTKTRPNTQVNQSTSGYQEL
jgi:hypothetical protein